MMVSDMGTYCVYLTSYTRTLSYGAEELKTGEVKALDDIPETPMDISGTYSPSLSLMYALVLVWLHARMRWLLGRPVRALLPHRLHA